MNTTLDRGRFLRLMGLGAASLALPKPLSAGKKSGGANRPNILFIFTDDHATHAISAYGSKINRTPNLDRIAKEGIIFRNCFCTNSICAPSRAVILTGKHSHLNGVTTNRERFDGTQQTFPKLLQKAGYQTAIVGKWHLKSEPTGFHFWNVLIGQGPYYNPPLKTPEGVVKHTGYTTDILTDIALDWLQNKRDPSRPFLLMYQHKAPHRNWQPGPKHLTLYDNVTIPEPVTLFDDWSGRSRAAHFQEMTIARELSDYDLKLDPPRGLTPEQLRAWNEAYGPKNAAFRKANLTGKDLIRWKYQRYIKDYLRCVASVDENVGRVLGYLEESGLAENTVVMYSSDQGFYLGDHGWFDKRWMYEESLRMPLMVRWPGVVEPGSENEELVQNLDFAETFLEIAGAEIPPDMQGRSLVPLLKGETPADWRKSIYYHYYEFPGYHCVRRHCGVRTKRYKLIHYYNLDEWELFDLERDPLELQSVYDDPAYADVVRELKIELKRLREIYRVDEYEEPPAPPDPGRVQLDLVLHYDFSKTTGATVRDASGKGHDGTLKNARIVPGREGKALQTDGRGFVLLESTPQTLNPAFKPFMVGAWCKSDSGDGVVVAGGRREFGFALFLKDNRANFLLRSDGVRYQAKGQGFVRAGEWVHVAGLVDQYGRIFVLVNGERVGMADEIHFILPRSEGSIGMLTVGRDTRGKVTDVKSFRGLIEDVRLYWGVMDDPSLRGWAST